MVVRPGALLIPPACWWSLITEVLEAHCGEERRWGNDSATDWIAQDVSVHFVLIVVSSLRPYFSILECSVGRERSSSLAACERLPSVRVKASLIKISAKRSIIFSNVPFWSSEVIERRIHRRMTSSASCGSRLSETFSPDRA